MLFCDVRWCSLLRLLHSVHLLCQVSGGVWSLALHSMDQFPESKSCACAVWDKLPGLTPKALTACTAYIHLLGLWWKVTCHIDLTSTQRMDSSLVTVSSGYIKAESITTRCTICCFDCHNQNTIIFWGRWGYLLYEYIQIYKVSWSPVITYSYM